MSSPLRRAERWAVVREVAFSRELSGLPLDVLGAVVSMPVVVASALYVFGVPWPAAVASSLAITVVVARRASRQRRPRHRRRWFAVTTPPGVGVPRVPAAQPCTWDDRSRGWAAGTHSNPRM
jgi:hypothetical protein